MATKPKARPVRPVAFAATSTTHTIAPNLEEIVTLAQRQCDLERQVASAAASLAGLQKDLLKVASEDLPTAMAEAGLKEFTLDTGEHIEIKEDFSVGIPSEQKNAAFDWLEKNGYGGLIKTEVAVRFGKGELGAAQKLAMDLLKKKLEAKLERSVPWQTLKAFVKERAKATQPVPPDLFGTHQLNKAVIKLPKST